MLHPSYIREFERYRNQPNPQSKAKKQSHDDAGATAEYDCSDMSEVAAPMDNVLITFDQVSRRRVSYHISKDMLSRNEHDSESSGFQGFQPNRAVLFSILVAALGSIASTLFLGFGISTATREQDVEFNLRAREFIRQIEAAWMDYETASMWLHSSCRSNNITRQEFRDAYDHITNSGFQIQVCHRE